MTSRPNVRRIRSYSSVSYTHLDVYKRQGQGLILQRDVSGRNVVDDSVTPGIRFENPGKVLIDIADEGIVIRLSLIHI